MLTVNCSHEFPAAYLFSASIWSAKFLLSWCLLHACSEYSCWGAGDLIIDRGGLYKTDVTSEQHPHGEKTSGRTITFHRTHTCWDCCGHTYCENIRNGYFYDGDLVFVILKGIYSFKFPKRFLEISSRDLTSSWLLLSSFVNPNHLKTWFPNSLVPSPLSIHKAECLTTSSQDSHSLSDPCLC